MVRLLWVYYGPGRPGRRQAGPQGAGQLGPAGHRPRRRRGRLPGHRRPPCLTGGPPRRSPRAPRLGRRVAARLRGRRPGLLRGQQPAGGGGAGAGRAPRAGPGPGPPGGGPGCRPCCWEWLRESDQPKRDLLATVSHELKTPLTVILGTLGTLSRRGGLDPAERREFVDMAVRQGIRLKELIE